MRPCSLAGRRQCFAIMSCNILPPSSRHVTSTLNTDTCMGASFIKRGFGLDLLHLIHSYSSGPQAVQRYCCSTHFQFTVAHALRFSVFTGRILATGLSQLHCNFKSHVKSSCHSLIPFLPLSCSCQFRKLNSTTLVCFSILLPVF
jgi:hypothetical protein